MVAVKVLRSFRDLKAKVDREPGDVFEATEERAAQIDAALPGYISCGVAAEKPDLTKLTVAKLRELCDGRGIEVPKGAKKADIISLLEE